jgi:uncharacterized protein YdhG (YjbR/CyaY superfamily)
MPTVANGSVAEYLASQPPAARSTLRKVRAAIRKALPKAEETLSYKIPTYRIGGKAVIYFAAWKNHYSIYPASRAMLTALRDDLVPYEIEKGTIRFPYDRTVPIALIARIAKLRAAESTRARVKQA